MRDYLECHDWDTDGFPGEFVYGDDYYVDDYYMDERFKQDSEYPDCWVSNKERVYNASTKRFSYGSQCNKLGHADLSIRTPAGRKHKYLHQMMAQAFIPNPDNRPLVRHLDDDPSNNQLDNLAWGTPLDNARDCIEHGRFRYFTDEDRELAMQKRRDPLVAVNLRDRSETEFESQMEASRVLGISQTSISEVVHGKIKAACGYYFYRPKDRLGIDLDSYKYRRHKALIKATDLKTGRVSYFHGQTEAGIALGLSTARVCNVINGKSSSAKGYVFEYVDEEECLDAY